jgi:tripartite-type tricarboxylate transporter receptor subunit TctC
LLAYRFEFALGKPVIVVNKPGAGGRIAAQALKDALPDGTTLLLTPMFVTVLAPLVYEHLAFDPVKDFAPVAQAANFQIALAVSASHPATSVGELVAWAKTSNGDQVNFGTAGAGSQPHFFGLMVGEATGLDVVHIPYKGAAPMESDLMGGRIPVGISALSDLLALHRAGRVRIIATSGEKRSPLLPSVATFQEQGFPRVEGIGWLAFYAPAGTPKATIEHWSRVVAIGVQAPDISARLIDLGLEPTGTTPEELARIMAADTARWAPIVKASGFVAN